MIGQMAKRLAGCHLLVCRSVVGFVFFWTQIASHIAIEHLETDLRAAVSFQLALRVALMGHKIAVISNGDKIHLPVALGRCLMSGFRSKQSEKEAEEWTS